MHDTLPLLNHSEFPAISRRKTEILQINIGLRCNQQCVHCHVNSSPKRTEKMDEATIAAVFEYVKNSDIHTLDITGGAPELHPQFRELVVKVRALNVNVIDRCNLTILSEPDQEDLAEFLAEQQVDIVASLYLRCAGATGGAGEIGEAAQGSRAGLCRIVPSDLRLRER